MTGFRGMGGGLGMYEQICKRCRRICFTPEQFENHECFDAADLDAEIALANWAGKLPEAGTTERKP